MGLVDVRLRRTWRPYGAPKVGKAKRLSLGLVDVRLRRPSRQSKDLEVGET